MSTSDSASDTAALVDLYSSALIGNYCALGATVFLIYEWMITSGQTINMFWQTKSTGASILFLANRYIIFVSNLMIVIGYMRMSDKSCALIMQASFVISLCQFIPWAAFSALRVAALCRSWTISSFVLLLSLAPIGINLAEFHFDLTGLNDPMLGCISSTNTPPDLAKILTILSRTCLITSDVVVIVVTWYTTGLTRRRSSNMSALSAILLRDGTIYFILLLILNCVHLTLTLLSIDAVFTQISVITLFTEPMTAVIVARFLLNLQAANRKMLQLGDENMPYAVSSESRTSPSGDSLVFARVIGSMGSSMLPENPDPDDKVEDEDKTKPAGSSDRQLTNGYQQSRCVQTGIVGVA